MTKNERVAAGLHDLQLELPSWAFGNSGTRFKVFAQQGVPRDPFEKVADAAQVHAFTGAAPSVALHIPWDRVDDYDELAKHADLNVVEGPVERGGAKGQGWSLYVTDPDGHLIELKQYGTDAHGT